MDILLPPKAPPQRISEADFREFVLRRENYRRRFEYHNGWMTEVFSTVVGSSIGVSLLTAFMQYKLRHDSIHVTGPGICYRVNGNFYMPDLAVTLKRNHPHIDPDTLFHEQPLALVAEVLSPYDLVSEMMPKVVDFLQSGTILWLVSTELRHVIIMKPNTSPAIMSEGAVLELGDELPGFGFPVKDLFLGEAEEEK